MGRPGQRSCPAGRAPIKTLPSRLDRTDIGRLIASGATPAGQPPLPPATGPAIELDRTVNASGNVSLGSHVISAGMPLAGQRITLRLDGAVAQILTGGTLTRTVACPIPEQDRPRLRGARPGQPGHPRLPEPQIVRRRVSSRGANVIGGQRIQAGLPHTGKTADISIEAGTYRITIEDALTFTPHGPPAATLGGTRHLTTPVRKPEDRSGRKTRQRGPCPAPLVPADERTYAAHACRRRDPGVYQRQYFSLFTS